MERYETKKVIQFMKGLYPNWRPDSETVNAWQEVFEEYSMEDVKSAVIVLSRKMQFIPSVAEIYQELRSRPSFDLLTFNDKMFVIKVYVINEQLEDTVFSFNYQTREEANEDLRKLKEHHTYKDIERMWIERELKHSAPDSAFRQKCEQMFQEGAL